MTLEEYTQEEYESDMMKLLKEKGLSKAVKYYLDEIDNECSEINLNYVSHRTIQEFLSDILFLCEKYEKENKHES